MLGLASALQLFPIFFALPILFRGAFDFFFRHESDDWRPNVRFGSALAAVLLAGFLVGGTTGRGLESWQQWEHKISVHKTYLRGEIFNIGLANLESALLSNKFTDAKYYGEDQENTLERVARLNQNAGLIGATGLLFMALWVLVVLFAPASELPGSGFLIMFTMASLSPFYYLTLSLVPFMFWRAGRGMRLYAAYGTALLFVVNFVLFPHRHSVDFTFWPHVISLFCLCTFFVGLAGVSLYSRRQIKDE